MIPPDTRRTAPSPGTALMNKSQGQTTDSNDRLQGLLPQFLCDLLASPPRHGDGVHQWLFRVARQLHAHRDESTICDLLAAATVGCGRGVSAKEILDAVRNARACAWQPSGSAGSVRVATSPAKWPLPDKDRIAEIAAGDPDALELLRKCSPVKISEDLHDADCLLDRLFPGNPLVCVSDGVAGAVTLPRVDLAGVAGEYSHLVPSPMTKRRGVNQSGKTSTRCLDNTGPRFYLITECDQGDHATQAAVIRHLAEMAPLTLVVDSAGKSLHAWWRCHGQPEDRVRKFFMRAVSLGADPATWTRCQLVRMPLGWRHEKARRQQVLFFDYFAPVKGGVS